MAVSSTTKKKPTAKSKLKSTNKQKSSKRDFENLLENLRDLYDDIEIEQIRAAHAQMKSIGRKKSRQIRPIVPIKAWLNDVYYVGEDVSQLYPFWKDVIIDIFREDRTDIINQIILTGSIGIGKSTAAALIIIRKIYELSCYEDISAMFNLFGVSRIAFAYLSVTREQAQNTGFSLLLEWIDSIPYFREHFKRKEGLDSMIIWPQERLLITYGSVANHFIGMNLMGSILDEANFFSGRSKEDTDFTMNNKVSAMYSQIIARSESRFIVNGVNHSLSLLVSSSTVASSFTEERILKALKDNDVNTYIVSPSLWEVKPWNYKGKKFPVYVGGDNIDPHIISNMEDINSLLVSKKHEIMQGITFEEALAKLPEDIKQQITMVPEEHKNAFSGDIIIALQDIAGFSTSSSSKLFASNTSYERCIKPELTHPFASQQFVVSTATELTHEGALSIESHMKNNFKFKNPEAKRFLHIDLALTGDSLGIAMSHISGWKTLYGETKEQQDERERLRAEALRNEKKELGLYSKLRDIDNIEVTGSNTIIPTITMDFMLRINPPKKPNKISIGKIRDFILALHKNYGINFELITADQFQSEMLLQELSDLGFKTANLSVDRTPEPYMTLTQVIYENRLELYDYEPFRKELFGVVYYPARKKVDHVKGASKDVADAVAGCVFSALGSKNKSDTTASSMIELMTSVNTNDEAKYKKAVEDVTKSLMSALMGR